MNRIRNLIAIGAFSLLVLGIPAIASAQYRDRDRDDDRYGNGGYNNGQYGTYGNYDMRSTVRSLKSRSRQLVREIDRDLDHSRYDGDRREDQINQLADQFKDAVDDLNNNGRQNDGEVRRVLDLGSQMDRVVRRSRMSHNVQNLWAGIRNDLQVLGGNGYYDNNRNNRNRSPYPQTRNPNLPSWWPF